MSMQNDNFGMNSQLNESKLDAEVSVFVSPDKMTAYIMLTEPELGGKPLTIEKVYDSLSKKGITYGIDRQKIEELVRNPIYNREIPIARGAPAKNGSNGYINFNFDINKDKRPTILDDGRVDFRDLNLLENVTKGQVLCTMVPPTNGIPGMNVFGDMIPCMNGKPVALPKGKNVEISEDSMSLIASIDGQVCYIDQKVSVYANFDVPADVDNSTGNIDFVGNVIVHGNVLSGFTIKAGGYVEVWGAVEDAVIRAEGDIILRRGMRGKGNGILESGNDIVAKYIEHCTVKAKNNVNAEAIIHCNVSCGNKLILGGLKGLLVGGSCKVGREISAKMIGSPMYTITNIDVGVEPDLKDKYKKAKIELDRLLSDLKKAEQAIAILQKFERAGNLTEDKKELLVKSIRTKIYHTNQISALRKEIEEMEERLKHETEGIIKVSNIVYAGTKVTIGSGTMHIKEDLHNCTLYCEGADIKIGPGPL